MWIGGGGKGNTELQKGKKVSAKGKKKDAFLMRRSIEGEMVVERGLKER